MSMSAKTKTTEAFDEKVKISENTDNSITKKFLAIRLRKWKPTLCVIVH